MAQKFPSPPAEPVDEQPQQRRVWTGPFRSIIVPLLAVTAIAFAIWYIEYRPSSQQNDSPYGIIFLSSEQAGGSGAPSFAAQEGQLAPDFVLETLEGGTIRLSDLRGKGVIVNFWATWCQPCRREIPELVAAYDRYHDHGLEILAVNLQQSPRTISNFTSEFGVQFPVLLDRDCDVTDAYRVTTNCRVVGIPTSFFIDPQGIVQSTFIGPFVGQQSRQGVDKDELEKRIEQILP